MPCPGLLHGTPGAVGAAPASCPTQHAAAQELRARMREQSRKGKAVSAHTPFRSTLLSHVSWNAQTQRERMLTEEHSRHSSGWIRSKRVQRWAMLWDGSCVRALPPSGLSLPCDTTGSRERAMWEQGLARGSWLQNESEKRVTVPIAAAGLLPYHPWVDFASPALDVFTINSNQSH